MKVSPAMVDVLDDKLRARGVSLYPDVLRECLEAAVAAGEPSGSDLTLRIQRDGETVSVGLHVGEPEPDVTDADGFIYAHFDTARRRV